MSKKDDVLFIILCNRILQYTDDLNTWSSEALKQLLVILQTYQKDMLNYLHVSNSAISDWSELRSLSLLENFGELTAETRRVLEDSIVELATLVGNNAISIYNDIVSFGGRISNFNNMQITTNQLKSLIRDNPLGGKVLRDWVDSIYDYNIETLIKNEIIDGTIQGDSYTELVGRIEEGFSVAEADAITIAGTYIQGINVAIQEKVYEENPDIIEGVQWVAALEIGSKRAGRGTCNVCAWLDGQRWTLDEKRPDCPKHPNCKCVLVSWFKSLKELGIDNFSELEETYSSWTTENNQVTFKDFFVSQSDNFKKEFLGPTRFKLMQEGKIKWEQLVSKTSGELVLLRDLQY